MPRRNREEKVQHDFGRDDAVKAEYREARCWSGGGRAAKYPFDPGRIAAPDARKDAKHEPSESWVPPSDGSVLRGTVGVPESGAIPREGVVGGW